MLLPVQEMDLKAHHKPKKVRLAYEPDFFNSGSAYAAAFFCFSGSLNRIMKRKPTRNA